MPKTKAAAESDHVIRVHDDPCSIDAAQWNALLDANASANPFMRHEYLAALQASGSAVAAAGWSARFLTIEADGTLIAACPLYAKDHSYGEYVFDWAWADAYQRHGLEYYPKLLSAVPFTPVPGARLLARDDAARRLLLRAIRSFAQQADLSSAHVLFLDEADQAAARAEGWMMRSTVQFHWTQPTDEPYRDFAHFLSHLQREKRKKIQQERRRINESGVAFEALQGQRIQPADWDFFYRCYQQTYREHHSTPYLTRDFFNQVSSTMPNNWLLFIATREGRRIASSLVVIDPERRSAYGRYWGAIEHVPLLHFEACYYQPLQWCIDHGYVRFEGGAQGEHKMARGLLPVRTASAHWLAHPQFANAVAEFLDREGAGIAEYLDELSERRPFKAAP